MSANPARSAAVHAAPAVAGRAVARLAGFAVLLALSVLLSSCSWVSGIFGGNKADTGVQVSVFDVEPGDCFLASQQKAELATLPRVPCTEPHQQEAYAVVPYQAADGSDSYPGDSALNDFANGACAQAYTAYVGINYLDSSLWFTYLMPSARSWQNDKDRSVICFVTTTGQALTKSVKGAKI